MRAAEGRTRRAEPPAPRAVLGQPAALRNAVARIHRPAPSPVQSGRANTRCWVLEFEPSLPPVTDPLTGWTGTRDTLRQVRLTFPTREQAIAFARRQGWPYWAAEPERPRPIRAKSYADNFGWLRRPPGY